MITSFNIYESLEIGEGLFLQKGVMVLLKNSWFLIIYPLKSFLQKIDQFIFCVSLSEIAASWDRDGRDSPGASLLPGNSVLGTVGPWPGVSLSSPLPCTQVHLPPLFWGEKLGDEWGVAGRNIWTCECTRQVNLKLLFL